MSLQKILIPVFCLFLFACNIEPIGTDTVEQEIIDENEEEEEEEEDTDNVLLKKTIETYSNGEVVTVNYEYDGNKLLSISDSDGFEGKYTYENNKIIKVEQFVDGSISGYLTTKYNTQGDLSEYILYYEGIFEDQARKSVFTYNSDNTITETYYYGDYNSQSEIGEITTYILDQNGNLTNEKQSDDSYELIYKYDIKNGVYKNISQAFDLNLLSIDFGGIEGNKNNTTEITEKYNGTNSTELFEYTYNDIEFPKTVKYITDGKIESIMEFFY